MEVTVGLVMSRPAVTVGSDVSAVEALRIANESGMHHLLVVIGSELLGSVCRCELNWSFPGADTVSVMSRRALAIAESKTVEEAAQVLSSQGLGCLAVVNERGELSGVLTRDNLRAAGVLRGEPGVDCCAACGDSDHLAPADCPGVPVFCWNCLAQVRSSGPRDMYYTLGGGD
jgi:CBS domain-containing protein